MTESTTCQHHGLRLPGFEICTWTQPALPKRYWIQPLLQQYFRQSKQTQCGWKPAEIPAATHHQRSAACHSSSVLFSRSMARAVFFLEDNPDVSINLALSFTAICNAGLQTDYFTGRKGLLEVCAGPRLLLLLFRQSKNRSALRVCRADFAFQPYTRRWVFCEAGIKGVQNLRVFLFLVYSQWVRFRRETANKAFPTGNFVLTSHSAEFNPFHKDAFCWATLAQQCLLSPSF